MTERELRDTETKEFDVDTGTYMEDVHSNDSIIGRDVDSDGLVDDVEKLIADADKRAKAYNEEKEREREKEHQLVSERENDGKGKDADALVL